MVLLETMNAVASVEIVSDREVNVMGEHAGGCTRSDLGVDCK